MGLDTGSAIFVCAAKSYGVDFADTLMIGRQSFFPLPASLQRIFSILNVNQDAKRFVRDNGFAEEFFRLMGAQEVNSLDFSSYEGATYVQDMNSPIPDHLRSRFSVVYDGGTLEHVFNVPQALTNCMEMIRVGGHFMQVTTANNFMGHGFWQFSPELLFRVFNESNGFKIEAVLLHEVVTNGSWYLVADPDRVQERVELCNSLPTHILTIAKKVADVAIFSETPQQSDYAVAWALHSQSRVQSATKKIPCLVNYKTGRAACRNASARWCHSYRVTRNGRHHFCKTDIDLSIVFITNASARKIFSMETYVDCLTQQRYKL